MRCLYIAILSFTILLLYGCANQVPLTGGPRDEAPPKLDTIRSFANEQTNYVKDEIHLVFDEFVQVKDATRQLVVSPPLLYPPTFSSRLKKATFAFHPDEVLKENTTYVINFGSSISDFNEGNKLENFTRVFSTGDQIDSLKISGHVRDAKTQEPVKDCLVMLYIDTQDSIVYKEKPYYFAKTDDQGEFIIKNLRADTFKIVALADQNIDYLYDEYTEVIGYVDTLLVLTDTTKVSVDIETFMADLPAKYLGYDVVSRGHISVEFDRAPMIQKLTRIDSGRTAHITEDPNDKKKVNVWYPDIAATTVSVNYATELGADTISIRVPRNTKALDTVLKLSLAEEKIHPSDDIILIAERPLVSMNAAQIVIVDTTSMDTILYSSEISDGNIPIALSSEKGWSEGAHLMLTLHPESTVDKWGYTNDTTVYYVTVGQQTEYGSIQIEMDSLPHGRTYAFSLMQGDKIISTFDHIATDTTILVSNLLPSDYSVEIYWDQNENGHWDSGDYLRRRQPEPYYPKIVLEKLRENWILEHKINASKLQKQQQ